MGNDKWFVEDDIVIDQFSSKDRYRSFLLDQEDYKKNLGNIDCITLEKNEIPEV
jgi:hypothetical protein